MAQKPEQFRPVERECIRIYNGDTHDLVEGMVHMDLIIEAERSKAAHSLARLVSQKLMIDGYVVMSDIDDSLAQFHATELLGLEDGEA